MSNIIKSDQSGDLSPEQIKVLSDSGVIPSDTPPATVTLFAHTCKEHGLSPFRKEMYLIKIGGKYQPFVGIDGTRKKAARTGQLAGMDEPKFDLKADGSWLSMAEVKSAGRMPVSCTVTVYRLVSGVRCPFTRTVIFSEFVSASNSKWNANGTPFQMITKVAESFALKSAFGDELAGLHIQEEAGAFEERPPVSTTVKIEEAIPEQFRDTYDQVADILHSYTEFSDVVELWKQQPDDGPAKMLRTFAKLFYDAAARTAQSTADLNAFYLATPTKWQQSAPLMAILSNKSKSFQNAKPA